MDAGTDCYLCANGSDNGVASSLRTGLRFMFSAPPTLHHADERLAVPPATRPHSNTSVCLAVGLLYRRIGLAFAPLVTCQVPMAPARASTIPNGTSLREPNSACFASRARLSRGLVRPHANRARLRGC